MIEIVWTLAAELDFQFLYERLDTRNPGAGDRFFESLVESIAQLQAFPRIGPTVHGGYLRRVLVYERHYGLFYSIESRRLILHAIRDLRGDPKWLERRLRR